MYTNIGNHGLCFQLQFCIDIYILRSIHPCRHIHIHIHICTRMHIHIYRYIWVSCKITHFSFYLSIYLSICLSIYLSIYLSIHLSIYPSHLSIYPYLFISIHIYPSIDLSIYRSIDSSICESIYLSIYLSIHPSIYAQVHTDIFTSSSCRSNPTMSLALECLGKSAGGSCQVKMIGCLRARPCARYHRSVSQGSKCKLYELLWVRCFIGYFQNMGVSWMNDQDFWYFQTWWDLWESVRDSWGRWPRDQGSIEWQKPFRVLYDFHLRHVPKFWPRRRCLRTLNLPKCK